MFLSVVCPAPFSYSIFSDFSFCVFLILSLPFSLFFYVWSSPFFIVFYSLPFSSFLLSVSSMSLLFLFSSASLIPPPLISFTILLFCQSPSCSLSLLFSVCLWLSPNWFKVSIWLVSCCLFFSFFKCLAFLPVAATAHQAVAKGYRHWAGVPSVTWRTPLTEMPASAPLQGPLQG